MNTYRAEITREDGWWMIRIPDLDLLTQAMAWTEVESMARGVIVADQDTTMDQVAVELVAVPGPDVQQLMTEAQEKAAQAEQLQAEVLAAKQAAARKLHGDGWSYRLIGKAMRLTHQRAEQLAKGRR